MKNLFKTFAVFIIVAIMQYTVFTVFYCMFEQTINLLPFIDDGFIAAYIVVYGVSMIMALAYVNDKDISDYYD